MAIDAEKGKPSSRAKANDCRDAVARLLIVQQAVMIIKMEAIPDAAAFEFVA